MPRRVALGLLGDGTLPGKIQEALQRAGAAWVVHHWNQWDYLGWRKLFEEDSDEEPGDDNADDGADAGTRYRFWASRTRSGSRNGSRSW